MIPPTKKQLKKDGNMEWYFVVWYLAATGARVSELIQIKIEHVEVGYFDLYTKGGKLGIYSTCRNYSEPIMTNSRPREKAAVFFTM